MKRTQTFKSGDRVRKRGLGHLGVVDRLSTLGVRVVWDAGPLAKERPTYCAPGELEAVI